MGQATRTSAKPNIAYIIIFLAFAVCSASCEDMYFKPAYIITIALMPQATYVINVIKMHATSFIRFMMSARGSVLMLLFSARFAQEAFERKIKTAAKNMIDLSFSINYTY